MNEVGLVLSIIGVILLAVFVQAAAVYGGCRMARIERATYLGALMITVKCWLFGILALPTLGFPLFGVVINIMAHFLIPTLVIKHEYRVDMDKAFWAAFGYVAIFILALIGVMVYLKVTGGAR